MKQKSIQKFLSRNQWALARTKVLELPWGASERRLSRFILQGLLLPTLEKEICRKDPRMLLFKQF